MKIIIDKHAGFCPGVRNAIRKAEAELKEAKQLSSYGSILHNEQEMKRLSDSGLDLVGKDDFKKLAGKKVLFRAHGEPPETYDLANENGLEIIDATCGVVRRLQRQVSKAAAEMQACDGQVLIYGKAGHPEIVGLMGHSKGRGILISGMEDLHGINFSRPTRLFSQTTMDGDVYQDITREIKLRMQARQEKPDFEKYDTICVHVSKRIPSIKKFADEAELLIFVSGKQSSNGKKLFNICAEVNPASYFISGPDEIISEWFTDRAVIGITGAASTPQWLMEAVAEKIREMK